MRERFDRPILIVGGGLAGMAAAFALADCGRPVILLERRPFLGGRVFSFRDSDSGAIVDNGQHVLVGACTRLRAFLERIGSGGAFRRQTRLRLPILDGSGRRADLAAAPLPAPLHLLAALARYRHLDLSARRAVAAAARQLARDRAGLDDDVPLADWLTAHGTPTVAMERFWEPLVRPALNASVSAANLPLAAFLIERGLWGAPSAGALWLPATGLSAAIGEPALRGLRSSGVDVRLGTRAAALEADGGRVTGVLLADGSRIAAERVVSALPPEALDRLMAGAGLRSDYAAIGHSAIVNVYLWYDRPVISVPFAGTFDSPLQWIFDRSLLIGREAGAFCVGVSLSAADELAAWPKERLAGLCDEALARISADRRPARLLRYAVVKEPRATFRAGPGVASRRPDPVTDLQDLLLAGDWTATGWPATMEGAVRSGERAAWAALVKPRSAAHRVFVP
jgi:squalene-associated FAD-dependent desaturase